MTTTLPVAPRLPLTLVKETNLEILYWEMMKSGMFHFIKSQKVVVFNGKFLFLTLLTRALGAPVNMTLFVILTCFEFLVNWDAKLVI